MPTSPGSRSFSEDYTDIIYVISAVTLFADLRMFDRIRALFMEGATLDYSSMDVMGGDAATSVDAREFWDGVETFLGGFDATQHMVSNFMVEVNGDSAHCISCVRAVHRIDNRLWTNGGFYYHDLVRQQDRWLIKHNRYEIKYEEGECLIPVARERLAAQA